MPAGSWLPFEMLSPEMCFFQPCTSSSSLSCQLGAEWRKENISAGEREPARSLPCTRGCQGFSSWQVMNSHPWQKRCEGGAAWQGPASSATARAGNAFKQEGLWLVLWLFSFVGYTAAPSAKELFGNLKAIGCRQRQLIF